MRNKRNMKKSFGFMTDIYNTYKGWFCADVSYVLEGGVIKYGQDTYRKCLFKRYISMKEHRFKGA